MRERNEADGSRGVTKGAKKALAFFLILIALVFLCDRALAFAFDRIHGGFPAGRPMDKLSRFLSRPAAPFLIILGSSKASHDVMPKAFSRPAFNLGYDGNYLLFSAGAISLLEARHRLGPVVLLHIDQKLFVKNKAPDFLRTDLKALKVYYGKVPWITDRIDSQPWTERAKFLFSSYRYNGYLYDLGKYALQKRPERDSAWDGFDPIAPVEGDRARLDYDVMREKASFSEAIVLDPAPLEFLEQIVRICRRNHTRLICFSAPHYLDQKTQYAPIHALLDSALAQSHVPFLDYIASQPDSLADPRFWKDLTHLNADGAAVFSRDLGQKVENPFLANFPP